MEQVVSSEMNFLQRIVGVFLSPTPTMESIDRKPTWVLPLIVILLISVILAVITLPITLPEQLAKQRTAMEEKGMSDEEIDNAVQISEKFSKILIPVGGLIVGGIFLALIALIIWFVGNIILGGQTSFKQVFSVYLFTSFISLLGMIIKTPIMLSKKTADVHFSLASFFQADSLNKYVYSFLKTMEVFEIWRFIVLTIGFAIIYKFSMKKAGWTMFVFFLFYAAVLTLLYSLQ